MTRDDLCGQPRTVDCGSCSAGELCSAGNTCEVCTPLDAPAFCAAQGKQCGAFTAQDPCSQQSRTAECGECSPGFDCDAANQCVTCTQESPQAFCHRLGNKNCGDLTALDNCRLQRTENCGSCQPGFHCDGNPCACTPEGDGDFCARLGKRCGALSGTDNCGQPRAVADCNGCPAGKMCDASNQCVCAAETNAQFCTRAAVQCGPATGSDNCGASRAVAECGPCGAGDVCRTGQCITCTP